jgi:hypothetical protein
MTIDGNHVGKGNYFFGFDTLHVKGDWDGSGYIQNVKHIIVDGNMGGSVTPGSGCEDLTVGGNLGDGVFGGAGTLSAVTVGGNIGNNCFGGCGGLVDVSVGCNIGNVNFQNGIHNFRSVVIGTDGDSDTGHVGAGNNFKGDSTYSAEIEIKGTLGSSNEFSSGASLTISGDVVGSRNYLNYNDVFLGGDIEIGNNISAATSVTIAENCTSIKSSLSGLTNLTVMATIPPTLGSGVVLTNSQIYVPAAVVDTYKAATGWSDYASNIQAIVTS